MSLCSPKIDKVDRSLWMVMSDKMRRKKLWEVHGGPEENRTFDGKAQIYFCFFWDNTLPSFTCRRILTTPERGNRLLLWMSDVLLNRVLMILLFILFPTSIFKNTSNRRKLLIICSRVRQLIFYKMT